MFATARASRATSGPSAPGTARIADVQITPTHDGEAALLITLQFPGGGRSKVQVTAGEAATIMTRADVTRAEGLIGKPWTVLKLREILWTPRPD